MLQHTFIKACLVLLWLYTTLSYGQNKVYHEFFTSRNGLSIDYIEDIIQDKSGFLWISGDRLDNREIISTATPISLQRFDGRNFHNLTFYDNNEPLTISKMIRFKDSTILLHCKDLELNNQYKFNARNSSIKGWANASLENSSNVRMINDHYYLLDTKDTKVSLYQLNNREEWEFLFSFNNDVNVIDLDRNSTFINYKGLFIFSDNNFPITITDQKGNLLKKFSSKEFNRSRDIISQKLWIEESFTAHDKLYAFMKFDDRLHRFNERSLEFEPIITDVFNDKTSLKTFKDVEDNLLIAFGQNGQLKLVTLDKFEKIVPIYNHDIVNSSTIQIWSNNLKKDFWLATNGELHYYKLPNDQFEKHLLGKEIRTIKYLGKQDYMIATENEGWYLYNHLSKESRYFEVFEKGLPLKLKSSRNILRNQDTLWSHSSGNIVSVHIKNGGSKSYRDFPVQCMEQLNDSTLIYGTNNYNLMTFNTSAKKFQVLAVTDFINHIDLAVDNHNEWVVTATNKGIYSYNLKTKKSHLEKTSFSDNFFLVSDFYEQYGFLLGSRDGNVIQYNPQDHSFKMIYNDDLDAGIATIIPHQSDLWINTFNGLVHYKPSISKTTRYSIKDGMSHNEGNRYSAATTENGILIGSLSGINYFIPEELVAQQSQELLQLLKIRKYDVDKNQFVSNYDRYAFAKANTITLPVENKLLELDFSLTGLNVVNNESYEYRLGKNDWVPLGKQKSIQFLNLAAGRYDLEIRAKDFSGNIIGNSLYLDIISEQFFYKKLWFILLVGLLITAVLMWFVYQERIKNLMQVQFSHDLLNNQEKERSRIAKELHDSVGQQLTLIKQTAQSQQLDNIAELTNTTLEEVRGISRNLYPVIIKQLGLKGAIEHLMLQIDEETDLFVSVIVDDVDKCFTIEQSVNIYRFIQECVSNILKHAQATTIEVSLENKKGQLSMVLRDNGKGFDIAEKEYNNSLGLKTLKERIRILNGQLTIESQLNHGSTIIATIPINK